MEFIKLYWKETLAVVSIVPAIGTLIFGLYKHWDVRRSELSWKKAETLFNLGYTFDSDKDISYAVRLLDDRVSDKNIRDFYEPDGTPKNDSYGEDLLKIDKMLNFLDRIACVTESSTITMKETANFSWYFKQITNISCLHKYCLNYGFHDVAKLGEKM